MRQKRSKHNEPGFCGSVWVVVSGLGLGSGSGFWLGLGLGLEFRLGLGRELGTFSFSGGLV